MDDFILLLVKMIGVVLLGWFFVFIFINLIGDDRVMSFAWGSYLCCVIVACTRQKK